MNDTHTHDKISLLRLAFKGLDDDELQEVADLTEFHNYPAGHVLCREGAYEDVLYIIADGNARANSYSRHSGSSPKNRSTVSR